MRKDRRAIVVWIVVGLCVVIGVALVALKIAGRPQPVPPGWSAPSELPHTGPPLAADQIAFDSDRTGNYEIFTSDANGQALTQLTDDPEYDSWSPRISPDHSTILFYRTPEGVHDLDASLASLWAIAPDGTGLVELRPAGLDGWVYQGHAEWSPDGTQLVMFGGSRINPQIHVTDARGQNPREVTERGGVNLDPSFSPDGSQIVFVGCPESVCTETDYEIFRIPVEGGEAVRVTNDSWRDHDPYWSPDGGHLAWLTAYGGAGAGVWDVRVGDALGDNPHRLFGDQGVTSRPEFSQDGLTIFVHRIPPGGTKFDVYQVNIDGTGATVVTRGQQGNNEYPSS